MKPCLKTPQAGAPRKKEREPLREEQRPLIAVDVMRAERARLRNYNKLNAFNRMTHVKQNSDGKVTAANNNSGYEV